jgi:hypothetical protein
MGGQSPAVGIILGRSTSGKRPRDWITLQLDLHMQSPIIGPLVNPSHVEFFLVRKRVLFVNNFYINGRADDTVTY